MLTFIYLLLIHVFIWQYRGLNSIVQGLVFAKQELYHLSHAPSPFLEFFSFSDRGLSFLFGASLGL
jgi:hypothetical protein